MKQIPLNDEEEIVCPTCTGPATRNDYGVIRCSDFNRRKRLKHDGFCPMCGGPATVLEGRFKCYHVAVGRAR